MICLKIDKVKNGYTITDGSGGLEALLASRGLIDPEEQSTGLQGGDTWVASTQDEVAKVVKTIIRGAFGSSEDSQPSGDLVPDFFTPVLPVKDSCEDEKEEEKADEEE